MRNEKMNQRNNEKYLKYSGKSKNHLTLEAEISKTTDATIGKEK